MPPDYLPALGDAFTGRLATTLTPKAVKSLVFDGKYPRINNMLLFFKEIYRNPILTGQKTDTVRGSKRLPRVGQIVKACVGPSRIFADLLIEAIEPVASLSEQRASQVRDCYSGEIPADAVLLRFRRVNVPANNPA